MRNLDAQHLLAVGLVAAALAPEVGRLQRRHQHFDRAGTVLLLAHDLLDIVENAPADRQPGINACGLLADQSGAQHQPVRHDLRLFRRLPKRGQEVSGETHDSGGSVVSRVGRSQSTGFRKNKHFCRFCGRRRSYPAPQAFVANPKPAKAFRADCMIRAKLLGSARTNW
jgi:hypothetical protein